MSGPVAILPSVGKAPEDARKQLDGALRDALAGEDGIDLLSPSETRAQLMSLAEMGLVCLPEDTSCLVKLGLTAEVAYVLVPVVRPGDGKELDVEIGVIDANAGNSARTVNARVAADDTDAVGALVKKALGASAAAADTTASDPPPDGHHVVVDDNGRKIEDPPPAPDPPAADAPLPVGGIVTGVAGGVGALALLGALTCDLVYVNTLPLADADTRQRVVQPLGATLWVTTALAAAGVGAGLYLIATAPPAPDLAATPPGAG